MMVSNVAIEAPVKKTVDKVYCKTRHKVRDNNYGVVSYIKSNATCHKCGKKGNFKRN